MEQALIIDFETTMRSPVSSKAHAMWPDNRVVLAGYMWGDGTPPAICPKLVNRDGEDTGFSREWIVKPLGRADILVGHNIKFDLSYVLKNKWLTPTELAGKKLWDTQLVEYLLSAQMKTYPSLDDTSIKYGGKVKDSTIADLWESGVATECIDDDLLNSYLKGDLNNTALIYEKQKAIVKAWGMQKLVESQMDALLAITLMEYEGMAVDKAYIDRQSASLAHSIEEQLKELGLRVACAGVVPIQYGEWNWASSKDVSMLFFGGPFTTKERELVGKYKNGKDKYKLVEKTHTTKPWFAPSKHGALKNKLGYYTVDDKVLDSLSKCTGIAGIILHLRRMSKQRETYYENLKGLLFPNKVVYPNINMVSTKTGRLSCNKPNVQNQTEEGGIKESYVSRHGAGGCLIEFDYQQLEMAGLAYVSGDEQLIDDINNGVDMHTELYRSMHGRAPTKEERKPFKRLSFGLVYGAGAKTLAEHSGCSLSDSKRFIEVFYSRYEGVAAYHKSIIEEAQKGRKVTKHHTPKGAPQGAFLKRTDTGRMFLFKEYDNEWKGVPSFSPTELKNWPVQGFSTGDVVPHMLGVLSKSIYMSGHNYRFVPIMSVHDSILLDCRNDAVSLALTLVASVLKDTTNYFNEHFGTSVPVKLSVGCSIGPNWGIMKGVDV
jgi:DNA polymerase I-like protein with 3'-5' exonuclease and polymerase domains